MTFVHVSVGGEAVVWWSASAARVPPHAAIWPTNASATRCARAATSTTAGAVTAASASHAAQVHVAGAADEGVVALAALRLLLHCLPRCVFTEMRAQNNTRATTAYTLIIVTGGGEHAAASIKGDSTAAMSKHMLPAGRGAITCPRPVLRRRARTSHDACFHAASRCRS